MNNDSNIKLGLFSVIFITIVSVDSIRNLPAAAIFGSQVVFFFTMAAIFFLIPCSLIAAQLATTWSDEKQGGIYIWLKKAFGEQVALIGIWYQWLENVIWYPTILSFLAATLIYTIYPNQNYLANHKSYLVITILISFWSMTLINCYGIKLTKFFSNLCTIIGLIIPMSLIIILGAWWVIAGNHANIVLNMHTMTPDFGDKNLWVSLTAIMLSFCGVEIAAVHARDMKNPQKNFSRAMIISSLFIVFTLLFGALSIAVVLPNDKINLIDGIMQSFHIFFHKLHVDFLTPALGLMLLFGAAGGVINWIIAPTKGLHDAAKDNLLPNMFKTTNNIGAPSNLLIMQALIVSVLSMAYIISPSVNGAYWLLTALASQTYMLMYILMFLAAIYLKIFYPEADKNAKFKIPGGVIGTIIVATLGLIGSCITFVVSFIPPGIIDIGSDFSYEMSLILGIIILSLPPFIFLYFKKEK